MGGTSRGVSGGCGAWGARRLVVAVGGGDRSGGGADQRCIHLGSVGVALCERQHLGHMGVGVVVGQHGTHLSGLGARIASGDAQVVRRPSVASLMSSGVAVPSALPSCGMPFAANAETSAGVAATGLVTMTGSAVRVCAPAGAPALSRATHASGAGDCPFVAGRATEEAWDQVAALATPMAVVAKGTEASTHAKAPPWTKCELDGVHLPSRMTLTAAWVCIRGTTRCRTGHTGTRTSTVTCARPE